MTDENRDIVLAKRTFSVPPLPFGVNMKAYPLARRLSAGDLIERIAASGGTVENVTEAELGELGDLAFLACTAAEPGFTRAEFDGLPIKPPQLLDAFFQIRYQTGVWLPTDSAGTAQPEADGEGEG